MDSSESLGESRSRCLMHEWGLPTPTLRRRYELCGHEYRADFDWDGRLVGEFDGMGEYAADDRIRDERARDADFQQGGIEVVHWPWADAQDRPRLFRIITQAMVRAGTLRAVPPFPG
ncbi:hypothetical protein [Tsukamurella soli]|uniref:DUF559 domain-containing protein n=1 Tax=Tsukamurella soli TaxID=644556 RepID=A0ABP8JY80_9ACTN